MGDDRDQGAVVADDFRAAGLGHLLVVSGQNVAFVLAVAMPVAGRLRPAGRALVLVGRARAVRGHDAVRAVGAAGHGHGRDRHRVHGARPPDRWTGRALVGGGRAARDRPLPRPRGGVPALGRRHGRDRLARRARSAIDSPARRGSASRWRRRLPRSSRSSPVLVVGLRADPARLAPGQRVGRSGQRAR